MYIEIYQIDHRYLYWLETADRLFKIDFEELRRLYPDVETDGDKHIMEKIIEFGKYKGKKFGEMKNDIAYLQWLVSIGRISEEDFKILTTN